MRIYQTPRISIASIKTALPLLGFDVNTSTVEEVEEGEIGAHWRNGSPYDPSLEERGNDGWGQLW